MTPYHLSNFRVKNISINELFQIFSQFYQEFHAKVTKNEFQNVIIIQNFSVLALVKNQWLLLFALKSKPILFPIFMPSCQQHILKTSISSFFRLDSIPTKSQIFRGIIQNTFTLKVYDVKLFHLQCAMEENCLASEAYRIRRDNPDFSLETRRLLRYRWTKMGSVNFVFE